MLFDATAAFRICCCHRAYLSPLYVAVWSCYRYSANGANGCGCQCVCTSITTKHYV